MNHKMERDRQTDRHRERQTRRETETERDDKYREWKNGDGDEERRKQTSFCQHCVLNSFTTKTCRFLV